MTDNYRAMYAVPTVHEPLPWVQSKLNPMTVISWSFVSNACTYDVITYLPEPACDSHPPPPTSSYRSKCLKPAHLHMSPRLLQISGFHTPGMPLVVPPVCPRRLTAGTAPGSPSLTDRLGRQPLPSSDGVPTLSPSRRFAFRRYRPLGDPTLLLAVSVVPRRGRAPRPHEAAAAVRRPDGTVPVMARANGLTVIAQCAESYAFDSQAHSPAIRVVLWFFLWFWLRSALGREALWWSQYVAAF